MSEWKYAQQERSEKLAKLHFFSVVKSCPQGDVELRITVKEFAAPDTGNLQFFAETAGLLCEFSQLCVNAFFRWYFFHSVFTHAAAFPSRKAVPHRVSRFRANERIDRGDAIAGQRY